MPLVELTKCGLYCKQADMYIDPWKSVSKALITHAHSDHARWGMGLYIAHEHCAPILKSRLGEGIVTQTLKYNEVLRVNGVAISFHPAGHVPGSAQIRLEYQGEVLVVSGDYKTEADGLSPAFEPVRCHTFITESTFGLPVFRWRPQYEVFNQIHQWWAKNREEGTTSVLQAYSLGKAQRILHHLNPEVGPIFVHTAVHNINEVIRSFNPAFSNYRRWTAEVSADELRGAMIVAPPGAVSTPWANRFRPFSMGVASGWMSLRGARRWQAADRGFVLSDHADWNGLIESIKLTGAEKILVTHGYTSVFVRWLREHGWEAHELETQFKGEEAVPETEEGASI
jgi:putative mRNA 3-end processing factor